MTENDKIDPERPRDGAPFDRDDGFTGEQYRGDQERALGRQMPAGQVPPPGTLDAGEGVIADDTLPPDNGTAAHVDPETGAARGTGIGAGGGQPGEDLDQDSATGDGPPAPTAPR